MTVPCFHLGLAGRLLTHTGYPTIKEKYARLSILKITLILGTIKLII